MTTSCRAIQELLVEAAGETAGLSPLQLEHLDACSTCRALAEAERRLHGLLAEAVPPADPAIAEHVMIAIEPRRLRRRVLALAPVAASIAVALAGVALVGGVPGGSLLAQLPLWSSDGWLALAGAASDWKVALETGAGATRAVIPPLVPMAAGVLALLGGAAAARTARRATSAARRHNR